MSKKIIHYCWFGHNPKSELILKCIESWQKFCPDYEIKEWSEENFDVNMNSYIKTAYDKKKWAFVSDYARLWIIYNYGGIYMDTDVELIKPLDDGIYNYKGFFCMEKAMINTGLGFYAKKNDPLVKKLLDSYNSISFDDSKTCVILNDDIFKTYFNNLHNIKEKTIIKNYIIYSNDYFCPLDYETRRLNITNNTIGIHWYGGSWFTKSRRIKEGIKVILNRIFGSDNINRIVRKIKRKE